MGDLANMTSVHGEVNGFRLLRWLRSRAEMAWEGAGRMSRAGNLNAFNRLDARAELLAEMADDLEAELTPPDYPEDDGKRDGDAVLGDLRTCPDCGTRHNAGSHVDGCCPACVGQRLLAPPGDGVDLGEPDTGPCDGCGQLADRVPVRDNGRVWFACPGCARRVPDDGVDLDNPALMGGPEQERQP